MRWVSRLLHRRKQDAQLDSELRFHVEQQAAENVAAGMNADEARRRALAQFGGLEYVKEETRGARGVHFLETLVQDIRFALRMLRKSPGFTAVVVLTLALGIGANTAIFSIVDAMFLRLWPVRDAAQLVIISTIPRPETGFDLSSYPDYLDIRNEAASLSGVAAYGGRGGFLSVKGRGQGVNIDVVSENYFSLLGVRPALGRFFFVQPEDPAANRQAVVLSYALWQQRYGADTSLPGNSIVVNGKDLTVLGVAPKEFLGLEKGSPTDLWVTPGGWVTMIPGAADEFTSRRDRWLELVARLKPNARVNQARVELETLAARLSSSYPVADKDIRLRVVPASEKERAGLASGLFLMAMVGLVLLIACANVANLLIARTERRQKEIALRQALGAGRKRLLRQLLTESLLLAALGGALGLFLAWWLLGVLRVVPQLSPIQLAGNLGLDYRAFLFTLALSVLTAVLFGLAPGLVSSRADLVPLLKSEEPRLTSLLPGRLSLRDALVAGEVGLSVVLLVGSGLLLRSLFFSEHINPGFDPNRNVLMLTMAPPVLYGYSEPQQAQFDLALVRAVEALPGVVGASYARRPPLIDSEEGETVAVALPSVPLSVKTQWPRVRYNMVSADFFRTIGAHILRGRGFDRFDTADSQRVVVINQMLARELWPNEEAVGQRLRVDAKNCEVAGVVENGKYAELHEAVQPYIFFPFSQMFSDETVFFVQTAGDPRSMVPSILGAARSVGGKLPVIDATTFADYASEWLGEERASVALLGGLSVLGMFLASVGLYAVVAYLVSRRTHEIGIRMALGARPADVLRLALGQGVRLAGCGVAIGLVAALAVSHLMVHRLYGIKPTDAPTYVAGAALAIIVAVAACWIPARRAMKIEPMEALRHE